MIPRFLRPEVVPYASIEKITLPRVDRQSSLHTTGTTANSASERLSMTVTKNASTPGPWRLWLSEDDRGAFMLHGDSPEPHGADMVIAQRHIGTPNGDEGVANARLIAAAPDLLAACKGAVEEFGEWEGPEEDELDERPDYVAASQARNRAVRAYEALRAAIQNAEQG